jgi:tetratricopeptide (TPR) repeat protein
MRQDLSFWRGLERYFLRVMQRSPLPYAWVALGGICLVVIVSLMQSSNSLASARNLEDVVVTAASRGDYGLAQTVFEQIQDPTFKHQVEDLVYPERKIEARIAELEQKLLEYPEHREIYLLLSNLYGQLNQDDKSDEYREKARILDPNR